MNQVGRQERFSSPDDTARDNAPAAPQVVTPPAEPAKSPKKRGIRRFIPTIILLLICAALSTYGGKFLLDRQAFVQETDARIVADEVLISSQVAGRLVHFPITEGLQVSKGSVLARVDARSAENRIKELQAQLATLLSQKQGILAQIKVADATTTQGLKSAQSKRDAARALFDSFNAEFKFAREEFRRAQALAKKGVIARQKLDQSRTAYLKAQQELLRGRAAIATADAELGAAQAERGRIDVLRREADVIEAKAGEVRVQIERQKIDLADRVIAAPLNAVVSRTFANPGEYVNPGQRIALLHNTNDIWIEARVKETDFRRLKLGQKVDVFVDAYPDQTFSGKVSRLGHATTAEFALLPTPNPSGNFTKITQRLPIRVAIPQQKDAQGNNILRPGMMVEIKVHAEKP